MPTEERTTTDCLPWILLALLLASSSVIICQKVVSSKCYRHRSQQANFGLKPIALYTAQPIKGRERYRVRMDVQNLNLLSWLTIDENYMERHRIRSRLLEQEKHKVLQCLPESYDACLEVLEEVVGFFCMRFSNMFEQKKCRNTWTVHNKMTGETFVLGGQSSQESPLEIAARLTMEDLSILMKNDDDEYYLAASATLFPVGWTVQERLGWTVPQLHNSVPLWHQQVSNPVSKFLARLTPASPKERSSYFVEVVKPGADLSGVLYRPTTLSEENPNPSVKDIVIRRERQTFRRLPRTGAIVFGAKTILTTLPELPMQELENLATEIRSWPDFVGTYKGREVWGPKALDFCDGKGRS